MRNKNYLVFKSTLIAIGLMLFACNATAQCSYFKTVVSGSTGYHSLGIKNDGTLWAWGYNGFGQLGDGTNNGSLLPEQIGTATNWVTVSVGASYSLGITSDGKLWAWGDNSYGQIGDGTNNNKNTPTQIGTASNWVSVSAGYSHSLGLTSDGNLWAWGDNSYGQIGDGTTGSSSKVPKQVGSFTKWVSISTGFEYSMAITADGNLWAWGYNFYGQLGDGTNSDKATMEQIGTSSIWVSVSAGNSHTLGITADGKLWAWGEGYHGALGDGGTTNKNSPEQIGTANNWVSIVAGDRNSLAITADGKRWAWGANSYGELGNNSTTDLYYPTAINTISHWVSMTSGDYSSLGLTADGKLWGWGFNTDGQLGDGTSTDSYSEKLISNGPNFTNLAVNGSIATEPQGMYNFYMGNNCSLIAVVSSTRAALTPIKGMVDAKVWIETNQPNNYVKRHYEIIPATNANTASGRVTLFFTQQEFTDFNTVNATKLPTGSGDVAGIANLIIEKRPGTSEDGTGLPVTYTGTPVNINPADADIIWNATASRWEVSFDLSGFGGFFVKTQQAAVPIQCTYFKTVSTSSTATHNLAIKNDGTLWAWGNNSNGQLGNNSNATQINLPTQIGFNNNWVSIAAGGLHSLGITADGKLWGWGYNASGQLGDGTTINKNSPIQIGTATNWVSIFAGDNFSMGITANGTLWAWGNNTYGQLGVGSLVNKLIPTQVGTATNWVKISLGSVHSLGITSDGKLWSWGDNSYGALGDNGVVIRKNTPGQIGTATYWVSIAAGGFHSLAITNDGKLWAWGLNYLGQLGDGTTTQSNIPEQIGMATNWVSLIGGGNFSMGLTADSKLWAWGYNVNGQLGDGTLSQRNTPTLIGSVTNWMNISAGNAHSLGFTADGKIWSWGNNFYGTLGDGTTTQKNTPTKISSAPSFNTLANSGSTATMVQGQYNIYNNSCNLMAAINNTNATLSPICGQVTAKVWVETTQPAQYVKRHYEITPTNNASTASARVTLYFTQQEFTDFNTVNTTKLPTSSSDATGKANLLIEKLPGTSSDGTGLPSTYTGTPVNINPADADIIWNTTTSLWEVSFKTTGFSGFFVKTNSGGLPTPQCSYFKTIITGPYANQCFGIKSGGALWAWGYNGDGELGDGSFTNQNSPIQIGSVTNWSIISAGQYHTTGITADGKLWAWGDNEYSQLGVAGNLVNSGTPIQIGTASNWIAVSSGAYHSVGITADGKLWAWGDNYSGSLGDGTTIDKSYPVQIGSATNWVSVSAGAYHSLGITADGKLWAWGNNYDGELGDGSTTQRNSPVQIGTATNWVKISAGADHSLGITADGKLWAWGNNYYGSLGDGTETQRNSPVQVGTGTNWVTISAGGSFSLGISADGKLWAWGYNGMGQLGDGTNTSKSIPTQIGTATNWSFIAGGNNYSIGATADGKLWAWGWNINGQIGNGTNNETNIPSQIGTTPNYSMLAATGSSTSMLQGQNNIYCNSSCDLISTVASTRASQTPISGPVTAKVWVESTQPAGFVKRHYQITPAMNANTATGWITLYFTQSEFDDYNAVNAIKLPTGSSDATGKSNLSIEKHSGISSDGTGLPGTYTGTTVSINPVDADIIWNAALSRWEVSFEVTGFSGFFVKTQSPLAIYWINVTGKLNSNNQATINWQVQEINVTKYEIEKSNDGINFSSIGTENSKGWGINKYEFTDPAILSDIVYYRIKEIEVDGKYSYSSIIKLNPNNKSRTFIYPNPTKDLVTVSGARLGSNLLLVDMSGKVLQQIIVTQNSFTVDLSNYAKGVYVIKTEEGVQKIIKE